MKVLVTGGAGFIGSHLAQALCWRGARVVVLDNLSTGKTQNLAWKTSSDDLELVRGEVQDESLLRKLLPDCQYVLHQAAMPSVPESVARPLESNTHNLEATLRLLLAAREAGVKRLIFASSSAVYGNTVTPKKHEQLMPDPLSPYALQKLAAEKYTQLFHRLYGMETVSLRYFNVFGLRQSFHSPYSGVIARFCTCMLRGEAPTIFGDGLQARDFVFVDNAVHANLLALEAPPERVAGKVFNIGAGESTNLLRLVEEINRITGQNLKPQFAPARAGDVRSSLADISAAQRDLGYQVKVHWTEGLARTIDYYRSGNQISQPPA